MENKLFYHFWSLGCEASPFDTNKGYSYLTEANDKKFIENLFAIPELIGTGKFRFYILELLNIYMNVLFDENQPSNKIINCYEWIDHTLKLFEYNDRRNDRRNDRIRYFVSTLIYPFITNFKPSTKISVLMEEGNFQIMKSLNRSDPFFFQFTTTTINININTPLNSPINIPINIPFDNPIDTRKVTNSNTKKVGYSQKVKTVAIIELLKLLNISTAKNDLTKICRLIAVLTGDSYDSIHNDKQKGIKFDKNHIQEITDINQKFNELNIKVFIDINKTY